MRLVELVHAAVHGDDAELRALLGPDDLVHYAPELHLGVVVRQQEAGQAVTIALCGQGAPPSATLEVPPSFRITEVRHQDGELRLLTEDGRVARGTPHRFRDVQLVPAEFNPRYREQCVDVLTTAHLRPEETEYAERRAGDRTVLVDLDSAHPERARELEPRLAGLLDRFAALERAALELVSAGIVGGPEEREPFIAAFRAVSLRVYLSGDFELHLSELEKGSHLLHDYWITVVHLADGTPVDFYADA
ncbi:hypothetical protein KCV87_02390 [Actinosynnema pretiosum subsp. pretiosum]|uniref:Uncharacterized protein n=1 Tax=Actinosynnema pretiosum subsp. pretiosum TaxID=103721 RepID=A0AA45R4U9_9PSEU|nr:hypothetical protein APASM_3535 [Actinosynnema pretiosum subsp. pretiosum]QUF04998.1 hypothetical protein KCV87_02390 [Actinosynnema pretiosum subsp. pretiosum]